MEGTLEGIALLKSGEIKITLPLSPGTRLSDLDALRGCTLTIEAATDTTTTTPDNPFDILRLAHLAIDKANRDILHATMLLKHPMPPMLNPLFVEPGLCLGRTEAGELPDELPDCPENPED